LKDRHHLQKVGRQNKQDIGNNKAGKFKTCAHDVLALCRGRFCYI